MSLQYYMPTRVFMGENCVKANRSVLGDMGRKALIVTGTASAKRNGSLEDVCAALGENGQEWAIYDRIMANPTIESVYEGARFAREAKADFVIAIGGGSPMDAGKAIALLACNELPEDELFSGRYGDRILPTVLIPTTAGTGSEVTQYSILTDEKAQTKRSIASPLLFPGVAFLDAKYTGELPDHITANTAIDALSHSIEGMLSIRANPITDTMASDSIRLIVSCFDGIKKGSLTQKQRWDLLYASTLGGMVIANTGTTAVHGMGYSLTYFKNIDHGRANGLLLASFMDFINSRNPERVAHILSCTGFDSLDAFRTALDDLLGDKEHISPDELEMYTEKAMGTRNITNSIEVPEKTDILRIYLDSFGMS